MSLYADIIECNIPNGCSRNANCHNTRGSYYCTCRSGYRGSGWRCSGQCHSRYKELTLFDKLYGVQISMSVVKVQTRAVLMQLATTTRDPIPALVTKDTEEMDELALVINLPLR